LVKEAGLKSGPGKKFALEKLKKNPCLTLFRDEVAKLTPE
jgi:hypothetical protein